MSTRSKRSSTAASTISSSRGRKLRKHELSADSTGSMCRVCMGWNSGPLMVDLFDRTVQGIKLAEVLSLVAAVEIVEYDRLPKLCCTRCQKNVEQAYKLRILCQDSDRKLRDVFSDVESVVVKEEFDAHEVNPLDVVCKPDVDRLLEEEESASKGIVLPKLEIEANEEEGLDGDNCNEMADIDAAIQSDVDAGKDEEEEDEPEEHSKKELTGESKKTKYPDVFDEVPAVVFRCCGCKNCFDTFEELHAHGQKVHAVKKLSSRQLQQRMQCDVCYKVLCHSSALERHKTLGKVNFRCKSCGDLFWNRRRACTHFRRIHGANPTVPGPLRICCACLEKFESEEQLKEHSEAVHLPEKLPPDPGRPFICNICYRNYRTDTHLYAHQTRMIKAARNHMCVECGKTFRHPGALRDHEIFHTGLKVFQCPHCPVSYSSKESFRKHVHRHVMPVDKYQCKTCDRCFRTPVGLKEHLRIHTGERPLQCTHCPASFARISCLNIHILTHTGERQFKCPLCEKRFGRDIDCKKHVKFVHYKLKPFPCFFCPKQYPRKDYRKRHMVSAHPNELRDNPLPEIELFGSSRWHRVQSEVLEPQANSTE